MTDQPSPAPVPDERVVYGAQCTWWGSISEIGKNSWGLPCCPHCGGMLYEQPNLETWWANVDHFENVGRRAGYRAFVEWMRGRCFSTYQDALVAYTAATRIVFDPHQRIQ